MKRLLLFPDPADPTGGTPAATPTVTPAATPTVTPPDPSSNPPGAPSKAAETLPTSSPSAAPPQSAEVVLKGTKTEREIALERRLSELEDENHQLKKPLTPATPPAEKAKRHWLDGGTFFHNDSD